MADWQTAAEAVRANVGAAYPEHHDDAAFWMAFARRVCHELDDGRVELDYDPHIALAFADLDPDAPPPDMTPIFQVLTAKPILSVRGALSDVFPPETVDLMRSLKADIDTVEVENVGHAPTLDEPAAWDAILDFLAKVP
jgi:pimeloyl-ACP methyl ester carboxylesterase